MAILNNISVTVDVDDEPLQEYDDNDHDEGRPNTVSKYIEATSGARFSLHYKLKHRFKFTSPVLSFDSCIGGVFVEGMLALKRNFISKRSFEEREIGSWKNLGTHDEYVRHFAFQELEIRRSPHSSRSIVLH